MRKINELIKEFIMGDYVRGGMLSIVQIFSIVELTIYLIKSSRRFELLEEKHSMGRRHRGRKVEHCIGNHCTKKKKTKALKRNIFGFSNILIFHS